MSIDLFIREFRRIVDSPDAVSRLRRFIASLAVTGRLSERKEAECPPEVAQGSTTPSTHRDDWLCGRIGDLLDITYGKALLASHRERFGPVAVYGSNGVVAYTNVPMADQPAIIIGRKGSAGALVIANEPSWTTDVAYYVIPPPYLELGFLFLQLKALGLESLSKGVKPGLSRSDMNRLFIEIPPVPEQRRIVTKVNELMSLCDQIVIASRSTESLRESMRSSSINRVMSSTSVGRTGEANARFFLKNSEAMIQKPGDVPAFRKVVLDLAVSGKLVAQRTDDEPAAKLLVRLRAELKRPSAAERTPATGLSRLPAGWVWAGFFEIGKFGRGKSKHRPRNDPLLYKGGTHPFIQTGDVARSGGVIRTYSSTYNDAGVAQSEMWPKGTLCITIAANIADTGILTFDACFPDSVVGLVVSEEFPDSRYFEYFLRTAKANLHAFAPSTAQKNINLSILNELMIPLPPLPELKRIVARVEELLKVCDELEVALGDAQMRRAELLEALLHEALQGTPGSDEDSGELLAVASD